MTNSDKAKKALHLISAGSKGARGLRNDVKVFLKERTIEVVRLSDREFLGKFLISEVYDSTLKVKRLDTSSRQTYYLPNPQCTLSFCHVEGNSVRVGQKGITSYTYEYKFLEIEA